MRPQMVDVRMSESTAAFALRVGHGTDGLALAYQRTQITEASSATLEDTAGYWRISVVALPVDAEEGLGLRGSPESYLTNEMALDNLFRGITERGLLELEQGRFSRVEDVKRRLGDI